MNYNKICLLVAFFISMNSTNLVYVSNASPAYPVQVIDVDTRKLVGNITDTYVESMGIAANSAGNKLYLVDRTNKSLDVIDVYQNAVVSKITLGDAFIYQVAITPDNSKAFITSNGTRNFYEVDLATKTVTNHGTSGLFNNSGQIVITEDGAKAYIGNFGDDTIVVWNIATQTGKYVDLNRFNLKQPQAMAVIPGSDKIYVAGYLSNNILVLNISENKINTQVKDYYSTLRANSLIIRDKNRGYYNVYYSPSGCTNPLDLINDIGIASPYFCPIIKPEAVLNQVYTIDKKNILTLLSNQNIQITQENVSSFAILSTITLGGNPQALVATKLVNNPPVVYNQTAQINKNTQKKLILIGTDIDGDPIIFSIVSKPSHGTLGEITQETPTTASVIYTPNQNYIGIDSFTFQGKDNKEADSNIATFSLEISNKPVVYDQTAQIVTNTPEKLILIGTDIDGDSITFSIVSQPSDGTLGEITQETPTTASVIYTPNQNYIGIDSFTFQGKDSKGLDSNIATFSLEISNPPIVYDQTAQINKNTQKKLILIGTDKDVSNLDLTIFNDSITFNIVSQPSHGTLGEITQETDTTASVIYTPNQNYLGIDSFTFQGKDSKGFYSNIATFSLMIFAYNNDFTDKLIEKYNKYFV